MRLPPFQILFIGLATALSLPGDTMLYAVLPSHYPHLGLLPIQVGILLSANRWIRLISNHLAERSLRVWRVEGWLVVIFLLTALVTATYGTTRFFAVLLLARCGWGICFSFMRQAGIMTAVGATPGEDLRQYLGYLRGFTAAGGVAGVVLGGLGHDLFGFTRTLLGFALLALAAAPLGYFSQRGVVPVPRNPTLTTPLGGHPGVIFCGLTLGLVGPGLVSSTLGLVLKTELPQGFTLLGVGVGVATLTGMALGIRWLMEGVAPILGALADRWGRDRLIPFVFLAGISALALAGWSPGVAGILAGVVLLFLCTSFLSVLLTAWVGRQGALAVATYVTASDFGSAMGPLVGWGLLAQGGISPRWIFLVGGLFYGLGALITRKRV